MLKSPWNIWNLWHLCQLTWPSARTRLRTSSWSPVTGAFPFHSFGTRRFEFNENYHMVHCSLGYSCPVLGQHVCTLCFWLARLMHMWNHILHHFTHLMPDMFTRPDCSAGCQYGQRRNHGSIWQREHSFRAACVRCCVLFDIFWYLLILHHTFAEFEDCKLHTACIFTLLICGTSQLQVCIVSWVLRHHGGDLSLA